MNYLVITLILFVIVYLCLFLKDKRENFENLNSDQCIDEDTKKVRETTSEEKKKIQKATKKKKNVEKPTPKEKKEVFLIYNKYSFLEAKEICKSYSGRLATEKDLIKAFKNGANWCSWGWLDGEMIGYPVQEEYWTRIEKTHKGFCGPTAGINKIANVDPFKRFSVTCYGIKPKKTKHDKELSEELNEMTAVDPLAQAIQNCKKEKQIEEQKKWVENQKKNVSILSFNKSKWSLLQ